MRSVDRIAQDRCREWIDLGHDLGDILEQSSAGAAVVEQRQALGGPVRIARPGRTRKRGESLCEALAVCGRCSMHRMVTVGELEGGGDEGVRENGRRISQRAEQFEQSRARRQVLTGEHSFGRPSAFLFGEVLQDQLILRGKVLVQRALGYACGAVQIIDPGGVEALLREQLSRGLEDPAPGTASERRFAPHYGARRLARAAVKLDQLTAHMDDALNRGENRQSGKYVNGRCQQVEVPE